MQLPWRRLVEFTGREIKFNTSKWKRRVLAITDDNPLFNDRAPCLFMTLSYLRASKELFNLKTEKPLGLSVAPKQGRERASNVVFLKKKISLLIASNIFWNKWGMWLNTWSVDWLGCTLLHLITSSTDNTQPSIRTRSGEISPCIQQR